MSTEHPGDLPRKLPRRELLLVGAGAAMAKALTVTTACANKRSTQPPDEHAGHGSDRVAPVAGGPTDAMKTFADTARDCVHSGEACLEHCLRLLASGDASMGECAKAVREMLAVCKMTQTMAMSASAHLGQVAALCTSVCESCEAACRPHAQHHSECADCAEQCRASIAAAAAIS